MDIHYGLNDFADNNDGTITDSATDLMWTKSDNEEGLVWGDELAWVQQKNSVIHLEYNYDWRLPNAKELQSIINIIAHLKQAMVLQSTHYKLKKMFLIFVSLFAGTLKNNYFIHFCNACKTEFQQVSLQ